MGQNLQEIIRKGHQAQCEGRLADSRAAFIDGVRRAAEDGDKHRWLKHCAGWRRPKRVSETSMQRVFITLALQYFIDRLEQNTRWLIRFGTKPRCSGRCARDKR